MEASSNKQLKIITPENSLQFRTNLQLKVADPISEYYYESKNKNFRLLKGDCFDIIPRLDRKYDLVVMDLPYFLSNGALTNSGGKLVSNIKGEWDKPRTREEIDNYHKTLFSIVREKMNDTATLWISGTFHNIYSAGNMLHHSGFNILVIFTISSSTLLFLNFNASK